MKKLMIAAAAILAAVTVNAAAANWSAGIVNVYDGTGSSQTSAKYAGTAYIFDATKTTQSALYDIWFAGEDPISSKTAGYVTSGTVASGSMMNLAFSYGEQSTGEKTNTYKFYVAIVDGTAADDGKIYFSQVLSKDAGGTATAVGVAFGNQSPQSQTIPSGKGYDGEKAWSAPEPTSAILMLLGVAGLALKRKQK